jgi:hypothetical protein
LLAWNYSRGKDLNARRSLFWDALLESWRASSARDSGTGRRGMNGAILEANSTILAARRI